VQIRWARSARRHRVSRARIAHVIEHCGLVFAAAPPEGAPAAGASERLIFLGDDAEGRPLEVMAVALEDLEDRVVEALADEAERGYDLGRAERVRVGRPTLSAPAAAGRSPRVNVRIPAETYEALRRRAREESRTLSDLTREALVQYVGEGRER
jgi:hypothetical protein